MEQEIKIISKEEFRTLYNNWNNEIDNRRADTIYDSQAYHINKVISNLIGTLSEAQKLYDEA